MTVASARKEEREACALIFDEKAVFWKESKLRTNEQDFAEFSGDKEREMEGYAAAIRARGTPEGRP